MRAREKKVVSTTLGDLIAAVTDVVTPILPDRRDKYMLVSYVLQDLYTHRRLRFKHKSNKRG